MQFNTLSDLRDLSSKRVLLRLDLNVPIKNGKISDLSRIKATISTLLELINKGAKIVILSHLGRPDGVPDPKYSLKIVIPFFKKFLKRENVYFCEDTIGAHAEVFVKSLKAGDVGIMENLRFHFAEEDNTPEFIKSLSKLGDIYVNDAFSACHRAHASIVGLPSTMPAYTGRLLEQELNHLEQYLEHPKVPLMAIVGGAKISTKLGLLKKLASHVNTLVIAGGMANTFLKARGYEIGTSLVENGLIEDAKSILKEMELQNCHYILPQDTVVASNPQDGINAQIFDIQHIPSDQMMLDVGPKTLDLIQRSIIKSETVMWNGSLGVNEYKPFDKGTTQLAKFIAERTRNKDLISIAGGGDTVGALNEAGVLDMFSYVSLAGGAFLEWIEGLPLPGLVALEKAKTYE